MALNIDVLNLKKTTVSDVNDLIELINESEVIDEIGEFDVVAIPTGDLRKIIDAITVNTIAFALMYNDDDVPKLEGFEMVEYMPGSEHNVGEKEVNQ